MRILHVISSLGTGGAESFLVAMATALKGRGFEQHVVNVTSGGAHGERLLAAGIPVTELGVGGVVSAATSIVPLREVVTGFGPDLLQGWMYHGDLFATLAQTMAPGKPKLFWNIRCSDMRLQDYALQLKVVVGMCARLSARPDLVIANSRVGGEVHKAAGYRPRRLEIVPNGIDVQRFCPDSVARATVRAELGLTEGTPLVLHVARVDPMKDHYNLLSAVEGLAGAVIVLAGKGTEALTRAPAILGLGERRDVPRLLSAGDIIVSSSAYGEGFSNAIAEGMAAGLVPVATDVGDAREIVGDCGLIVPVRDPEALRSALDRVLALSPEERRERGRAARARIEKNFSLERAVGRFAELYSGRG